MDAQIQAGVALVTGAGSGIGRAIAIRFAREGCRKLFLVDLNHDSLQETQQVIHAECVSAEVVVHVADVTRSEMVQGMVQECVSKFERLDFALNNAGVALGGIKTADMTLDMFDKSCQVNEKGNFLCQKSEIHQMLQQEPLAVFDTEAFHNRCVRGSIVNTASISGLVALPDFAAYASSKHAVTMMTRQIAREYAPQQIRVNSVCPGIVDTPGIHRTGLTPQFKEGLSKQAPMNRFIHADEVAQATVFLCSSRASAITGVNLPVDCGATTYHLV